MEKRLSKSGLELNFADQFSYIIVNDDFKKTVHDATVLVENFGTEGYFSCMNSASLVAGNSSSGIIEAASFKKYAVNIGDRQKGRAVSENVIGCIADADSIEAACRKALALGSFEGDNIYYKKGAVEAIIKAVKKWKA